MEYLTCPNCSESIPLGRYTPGADANSAAEVYQAFKFLIPVAHEEFYVALLDVKNKIIKKCQVSVGSLSATVVHPREAFLEACKNSAHCVVFVHNHPSGNPDPSDADVSLTKRLVSAGDILGIQVVDHVIVGNGEYYSFADMGRLR